jgi:nicotinamidase-related amidase
MAPRTRALLVIDLQNDYFPGGRFPLWDADLVLANVEGAIARARAEAVPVVLVRHVADARAGASPFLAEGSAGADIHPRVLAAAPDAPVVVKRFADAFFGTTLAATLAQLGVTDLLVCGMMTQNCVAHTVLSKSAEKYEVSVLVDCCTTVSEILHNIAVHAMSTRVTLARSHAALRG